MHRKQRSIDRRLYWQLRGHGANIKTSKDFPFSQTKTSRLAIVLFLQQPRPCFFLKKSQLVLGQKVIDDTVESGGTGVEGECFAERGLTLLVTDTVTLWHLVNILTNVFLRFRKEKFFKKDTQ